MMVQFETTGIQSSRPTIERASVAVTCVAILFILCWHLRSYLPGVHHHMNGLEALSYLFHGWLFFTLFFSVSKSLLIAPKLYFRTIGALYAMYALALCGFVAVGAIASSRLAPALLLQNTITTESLETLWWMQLAICCMLLLPILMRVKRVAARAFIAAGICFVLGLAKLKYHLIDIRFFFFFPISVLSIHFAERPAFRRIAIHPLVDRAVDFPGVQAVASTWLTLFLLHRITFTLCRPLGTVDNYWLGVGLCYGIVLPLTLLCGFFVQQVLRLSNYGKLARPEPALR